ncbi:MAG: tripartite tricarboxylate transporter substrate binding protein, partial [Pseudomonadota bacterium]
MRPPFGPGRLVVLAAAVGLVATVSPASAVASEYPTGPVTLTVGFGPGGPSDTSARFLQRYFEEVTGQELVIRNLPGAGGARS